MEISVAFALLLLYSAVVMLYCAKLLPNITSSEQSILEADKNFMKFGVAIDKKTIAMIDALREDIQTAKNWKEK